MQTSFLEDEKANSLNSENVKFCTISPNIGKTGEYFVCYLLSQWGWVATLMSEQLPYDIRAEKQDHDLRLQVKSTLKKTSNGSYRFNTQRPSNPYSRVLKKPYQENDFDLYVLVALDIERILFFRPPLCKGIRIQPRTFDNESMSLDQYMENWMYEDSRKIEKIRLLSENRKSELFLTLSKKAV